MMWVLAENDDKNLNFKRGAVFLSLCQPDTKKLNTTH